MTFIPTGRYLTTKVAGKSVQAFVPNPLPPTITAWAEESLAGQIQAAEAALACLEQAGQILPLPDGIADAFLLKEALASSAIQGN